MLSTSYLLCDGNPLEEGPFVLAQAGVDGLRATPWEQRERKVEGKYLLFVGGRVLTERERHEGRADNRFLSRKNRDRDRSLCPHLYDDRLDKNEERTDEEMSVVFEGQHSRILFVAVYMQLALVDSSLDIPAFFLLHSPSSSFMRPTIRCCDELR